jgi:hypothetical protein
VKNPVPLCMYPDKFDDEGFEAEDAKRCGKPARWRSCHPWTNTPTCDEHKCRCARLLPVYVDGIPRRDRVDCMSNCEQKILAAEHSVESLGADLRLTRAGTLLALARDIVADYIEDPEGGGS